MKELSLRQESMIQKERAKSAHHYNSVQNQRQIMSCGGPAAVMSLNSKVQKDPPQYGHGNSMMTSFYGAPDEFIGKI